VHPEQPPVHADQFDVPHGRTDIGDNKSAALFLQNVAVCHPSSYNQQYHFCSKILFWGVSVLGRLDILPRTNI
jgi:hypothetical protein